MSFSKPQYARLETVRAFYALDDWNEAVDYVVGRFTVYRDKASGEYFVAHEAREDRLTVFDDEVEDYFEDDTVVVDGEHYPSLADVCGTRGNATIEWGNHGSPVSTARVR